MTNLVYRNLSSKWISCHQILKLRNILDIMTQCVNYNLNWEVTFYVQDPNQETLIVNLLWALPTPQIVGLNQE
jgi:hypothetical protein